MYGHLSAEERMRDRDDKLQMNQQMYIYIYIVVCAQIHLTNLYFMLKRGSEIVRDCVREQDGIQSTFRAIS